MTIECEIDVHSENENQAEYVEVSVYGRIIGGYDTMDAALRSLAGYLVRSYPSLPHTLKVNLIS